MSTVKLKDLDQLTVIELPLSKSSIDGTFGMGIREKDLENYLFDNEYNVYTKGVIKTTEVFLGDLTMDSLLISDVMYGLGFKIEKLEDETNFFYITDEYYQKGMRYGKWLYENKLKDLSDLTLEELKKLPMFEVDIALLPAHIALQERDCIGVESQDLINYLIENNYNVYNKGVISKEYAYKKDLKEDSWLILDALHGLGAFAGELSNKKKVILIPKKYC